MENVFVALIVLGALAYMGRKFYKAVTARGRGSCGCSSCRCGEGTGHTSCTGGKHKELTPPCCSRPQ